MDKKTAAPPIPPLSVKDAHALEGVEANLNRALENCMDRYGAISNELKAKTYLSSYVVKIFGMYLQAYITSPSLNLWIPELKSISAKWALGCLAGWNGVTDEDLERYGDMLLATLDEHVRSSYGNSSNPLLATLAESQLEAERARAYAAAGIDLASAGPLVKMVVEAQRREHLQPPAPLVITPPRPKRSSAHITNSSAARKMQEFMDSRCLNQTEFATQANTSDKTIRKFLRTGQIKRSIVAGIASAMGITIEELLRH